MYCFIVYRCITITVYSQKDANNHITRIYSLKLDLHTIHLIKINQLGVCG